MIFLELPYPPTMNSYWRRHGRIIHLSTNGRQYRERVAEHVLKADARASLESRLRVEILASPPDRRKRDLDNLLKPILDSLQHAGVFVDDEQIDHLTISRILPSPGGSITVAVGDLNAWTIKGGIFISRVRPAWKGDAPNGSGMGSDATEDGDGT